LAGRKIHPPWKHAGRPDDQPVVLPPSTWLLRTGWRKLGELSVFDGPRPSRSRSARGL
jgi:hypothetical protein